MEFLDWVWGDERLLQQEQFTKGYIIEEIDTTINSSSGSF